jgi:hypothetical protein
MRIASLLHGWHGMDMPIMLCTSIGHHKEVRNAPDTPAYGLWALVILNAAVFIIFACSFAPAQCA